VPAALTVLVNAGPWLPVPPPDYGGIENVVATLVPELRARGHRVVLATVGDSTVEADEVLSVFPRGQFGDITGPYNAMMGIAHAHMTGVLDRLAVGDVDLVHDHLEVVGPALYAAAGDAVPPVLQTLHWDLAKHPDFYSRFDGRGRVFFAGVSGSQLARAHPTLRRQALGAIPLATPMPAEPPAPAGGHLLGLGRLTPVKGYDLAARVARRLDLRAGAGRAGRRLRRTGRAGRGRAVACRRALLPVRGGAAPRRPGALGRLGRRARPRPSCCAPPGRWCSRCAGTSRAAPRWSRRWPPACRWWRCGAGCCPSWSTTG
jgi:hypothetical protein